MDQSRAYLGFWPLVIAEPRVIRLERQDELGFVLADLCVRGFRFPDDLFTEREILRSSLVKSVAIKALLALPI